MEQESKFAKQIVKNFKNNLITYDEATNTMMGYRMSLESNKVENTERIAILEKGMKSLERAKKKKDKLIAETMPKVKQVFKLQQVFVNEEPSMYKVSSTFGMAHYIQEKIGNDSSETVLVLALNTKLNILAYSELFRGSVNRSLAHPREIMQFVLLNNATKFILAHNHPSGNPHPSSDDESITMRMKEVGELMGIELLDHIIVTSTDEYFSFREQSAGLF